MIITDIHLHTHFSPDSQETMLAYCKQAIQMGVKVITFTEHLEKNEIWDTFATFDFDKYLDEINKLQDIYSGKLLIYSGIEFGEPHLHKKQLEQVSKLPLDLIIGSIHYPFDSSMGLTQKTIEQVYEQHYKVTLDLANYGKVDVMGHLDFPRKFSGVYNDNVVMMEQILKSMITNNLVPEINTSTLRMGMPDPLPSYKMIDLYAALGGEAVTITSDSHTAQSVGTNFETVKTGLHKNLYNCYFVKHKAIRTD